MAVPVPAVADYTAAVPAPAAADYTVAVPAPAAADYIVAVPAVVRTVAYSTAAVQHFEQHYTAVDFAVVAFALSLLISALFTSGSPSSSCSILSRRF